MVLPSPVGESVAANFIEKPCLLRFYQRVSRAFAVATTFPPAALPACPVRCPIPRAPQPRVFAQLASLPTVIAQVLGKQLYCMQGDELWHLVNKTGSFTVLT